MGALVITGATGHLGGGVVARLAATNTPMRLVVRDPSRAPQHANVEVAQASFSDTDALRSALEGAETIFMVSAHGSADRLEQHRSFIDAAADVGAPHIVYISFFGAAPDAIFTHARVHWATEEHIRARGLPFTFLRNNLYAEILVSMVGDDGAIRGPAGDGRVATVVRDDIAEASSAILRDPQRHVGAIYDVTGPEALRLAEVASIITKETGRPVRYEEETNEQAYASRGALGAPDWQVEAWVSSYTSIADGELDGATSAIADLTGREPTSFAAFLARH